MRVVNHAQSVGFLKLLAAATLGALIGCAAVMAVAWAVLL